MAGKRGLGSCVRSGRELLRSLGIGAAATSAGGLTDAKASSVLTLLKEGEDRQWV